VIYRDQRPDHNETVQWWLCEWVSRPVWHGYWVFMENEWQPKLLTIASPDGSTPLKELTFGLHSVSDRWHWHFVCEWSHILVDVNAKDVMLSLWYYGHIPVVVVVVLSPVDSEYIRTWCRCAVSELSVTQNSRAPSVEKTYDDVICGQKYTAP